MSTYPYTCGDLTRFAGLGLYRPSAVEVGAAPPQRVTVSPSRTGRQDVGATNACGAMLGLPPLPRVDDNLLRLMDLDPALVVSRAVITAPIREAGKSYEAREGTPDEWVNAVKASIDPLWDEWVREALDVLSMGWRPFEVVYGDRDGETAVVDLKPLAHARVTPLVVRGTGEFAGYRTTGGDGRAIDLPPAYCLNVTTDARDRSPFGHSWHLNALQSWWQKQHCLLRLAKLGRKASGIQGVMYFPPAADEATNHTNEAKAQTLSTQAMAGEGLVFPNATGGLNGDQAADFRNIQGMAESALWKFDLMDHGSTGPDVAACLDELRYHNADLSRAWNVPERASQQGQHGTNAESETQSQINQAVSQLVFDAKCWQLSRGPIDRLLVARFGERARGAVTIRAGKIRDVYSVGDWKLMDALLLNADTFAVLAREIDVDAVLTRRGFPKLKGVIDFAKLLREQDDKRAEADAMLAEVAGQQPGPAGPPPADPLALDRALARLIDPEAGPFAAY